MDSDIGANRHAIPFGRYVLPSLYSFASLLVEAITQSFSNAVHLDRSVYSYDAKNFDHSLNPGFPGFLGVLRLHYGQEDRLRELALRARFLRASLY